MTNKTTKPSKAYVALTKAEQFFYDNAGYSVAQGETQEEGKIRCAKDLAAAEEFARELEWAFEWRDEEDCCDKDQGPHECLYCVLRNYVPSCYDSHGRPTGGAVLASLGSICEPSAEYKRVVEAELASEAMTNELAVAKMMHV